MGIARARLNMNEICRRGDEYKLTMGKYPAPKHIWNRKIIAVAPYAVGRVPMDNKIAVIMKQKD